MRGMTDSRKKGAAFERQIVNRLNDFFAAHNLDITLAVVEVLVDIEKEKQLITHHIQVHH